MTFWKVNDKRINCKISQQEIREMGYQLSELQKSQEKTREFISLLLRNAKQFLDINMEDGVQNFVAALLPDQSLYLSISSVGSDEEIDQNLDDVREAVEKMKDMIDKENLEKIKDLGGQEKLDAYMDFMNDLKKIFVGDEMHAAAIEAAISSPEEPVPHEFTMKFENLDQIIDFCHVCGNTENIESRLLKKKDSYYINIHFQEEVKKREIFNFINLAGEFGGRPDDSMHLEHLLEHGEVLVKDGALKKLMAV